jgi:hypothetical protein
MSEASFASLSPTLLARKGGAKPAMRPQLASLGQVTGETAAANLEDLGWDDMGDEDAPREAEVVHLTPAPHHEEADEEAHEQDLATASVLAEKAEPVVRKQQVELAERVAAVPIAAPEKPAAKPRAKRSRRSALDRGDRAAFTLRLDSGRHLKLRLACAVRNRSAQQLVTEALDYLLEQMPEIDTLASQVKRT